MSLENTISNNNTSNNNTSNNNTSNNNTFNNNTSNNNTSNNNTSNNNTSNKNTSNNKSKITIERKPKISIKDINDFYVWILTNDDKNFITNHSMTKIIQMYKELTGIEVSTSFIKGLRNDIKNNRIKIIEGFAYKRVC